MTECFANANHWTALVAGLWLAHSGFEFWLGKSQKVKAASTWELLLTGAVALLVLMNRRKKDG